LDSTPELASKSPDPSSWPLRVRTWFHRRNLADRSDLRARFNSLPDEARRAYSARATNGGEVDAYRVEIDGIETYAVQERIDGTAYTEVFASDGERVTFRAFVYDDRR
jgi:hypothetical protein